LIDRLKKETISLLCLIFELHPSIHPFLSLFFVFFPAQKGTHEKIE